MLHPGGFVLALPPLSWAAEKSPCLGTRVLEPVPSEPLEQQVPRGIQLGVGAQQTPVEPPLGPLQGLRGELWGGAAWEEDAVTFYLDNGDGNAATVIYDYKNLLVSYRARLHRACFVTRVGKDNIPGLDAAVEIFQRRQVRTWLGQGGLSDKISVPLADRSLLGTTAGILCNLLPVYWA
uniref:BRICHOS domain-containing protein n=1 Tax=Taeniopygia guttata TaxID=59729 RepID=A0A674HVQ7_TAEGU